MANTEFQSQGKSFTEHLVFVALLVPTFVVLAAAVVSLARLEPIVAFERAIVTAAACETCPTGQDGDEGP